jgi:hypothetical protein
VSVGGNQLSACTQRSECRHTFSNFFMSLSPLIRLVAASCTYLTQDAQPRV